MHCATDLDSTSQQRMPAAAWARLAAGQRQCISTGTSQVQPRPQVLPLRGQPQQQPRWHLLRLPMPAGRLQTGSSRPQLSAAQGPAARMLLALAGLVADSWSSRGRKAVRCCSARVRPPQASSGLLRPPQAHS